MSLAGQYAPGDAAHSFMPFEGAPGHEKPDALCLRVRLQRVRAYARAHACVRACMSRRRLMLAEMRHVPLRVRPVIDMSIITLSHTCCLTLRVRHE